MPQRDHNLRVLTNRARAASILLYAVAALAVAATFIVAIITVFFPFDLTYPEGAVAWATWLAANGDPLYSDWREWPHRYMPYGPLLCYPVAGLAALLHLPYGFWSYGFGRAQSLLALICIVPAATACIRVAYPQLSRLRLALLVAFQLALWPIMTTAMVSFRADYPAILFSLIAVWMVARSGPARTAWIATLPVLIANAYKPSALAAPVAIVLWYIICRNWRRGLMWGALLTVEAAIYVGAMELLTGRKFLLNEVGASAMGTTFDNYHLLGASMLSFSTTAAGTVDQFARLFLALPFVIFVLRPRRSDENAPNPAQRLLALYLLAATVIGMLTLFKAGAAFNYLLEAYIAATAIWAGLLVRATTIRERTSWRKPAVVLLLLLFILPVPMHFATAYRLGRERARTVSAGNPLPELMKLGPKPLLADLSYLHPLAAAHDFNDPGPYFHQLRRGYIKSDDLLRRLKSREYSHVVLSRMSEWLLSDPTPSVRDASDALRANYIRTGKTTTYELWQARPRE